MKHYTPYTPYSYLSTNAYVVMEGMTANEAKPILNNIGNKLSSYETNTNEVRNNNNAISTIINNTYDSTGRPIDSRYNGTIPANGKPRPTIADEMVNDSVQLAETNNQIYIFGSIAAASLVILSMYI